MGPVPPALQTSLRSVLSPDLGTARAPAAGTAAPANCHSSVELSPRSGCSTTFTSPAPYRVPDLTGAAPAGSQHLSAAAGGGRPALKQSEVFTGDLSRNLGVRAHAKAVIQTPPGSLFSFHQAPVKCCFQTTARASSFPSRARLPASSAGLGLMDTALKTPLVH